MPKKKRVQERENCVSCASKEVCVFRVNQREHANNTMRMFSHDLNEAMLLNDMMHMFDNYISKKCRFYNRKK